MPLPTLNQAQAGFSGEQVGQCSTAGIGGRHTIIEARHIECGAWIKGYLLGGLTDSEQRIPGDGEKSREGWIAVH